MRAGRAARLQRRGGRVVSRGAHQVGRRRDAERGRRGGEGVALERVRRAAGQRRGERAEAARRLGRRRRGRGRLGARRRGRRRSRRLGTGRGAADVVAAAQRRELGLHGGVVASRFLEVEFFL